MPFVARDPIVRFFENVEKKGDDECWIYKSGKDTDGYGRIKVKNKTIKAHRFSFEYHNARTIEDGKLILHSCDNPCCVNPYHLREGTHEENMKDKSKRGRISGERNRLSKLTNDDAEEIRHIWSVGNITQQELADEYNVSQHVISNIVLWKSYK